MPNAQKRIFMQLPSFALTEILQAVLARFGYRQEMLSDGYLKAIKQESGSVMSARKYLRYELTVEWELENADEYASMDLDDLDLNDEELWPFLDVFVYVEENQNTWTGSKCVFDVENIIAAICHDADRWVIQNRALAKDNRFGSARWATVNDLNQQDYLTADAKDNRLLVGLHQSPGNELQYLTVPAHETERHALVCGPTGCGKTATVFVPNLLERISSSAIVTEATPGGKIPDLLLKTSGFRKNAGHAVYYFNPDDPRSHRINPIDRVKTITHAQELAEILIRNTTTNTHTGDQVWETAERQLLSALIMIAACDGGDFAMVRRMLTYGRQGLKRMVEDGPEGPGRDECLAMFSLSTDGFLNGVMVGLMVRLGPWLNPTIAALTATTDFEIGKITDELFTFYLAVPAGKRQCKPVAAVVLNFLLDVILDQLRYKDKFAYPLSLFLDELTNFGYIPDLSSQLTILRHANIPLVLGIQDIEQLRKVYGNSDAKIIFSQPATRIFFRPNELETARQISDELGTGTKRDTTSRGGARFFPRKLLTPDEVRTLRKDRAIGFLPSTHPVKFWKLMPEMYDVQMQLYPPVLLDPLDVTDSLTAAVSEGNEQVQKEIFESASKDYPQLFEPAPTIMAEEEILAEQNRMRKGFTRQSLEGLKDIRDGKSSRWTNMSHDERSYSPIG